MKLLLVLFDLHNQLPLAETESVMSPYSSPDTYRDRLKP